LEGDQAKEKKDQRFFERGFWTRGRGEKKKRKKPVHHVELTSGAARPSGDFIVAGFARTQGRDWARSLRRMA